MSEFWRPPTKNTQFNYILVSIGTKKEREYSNLPQGLQVTFTYSIYKTLYLCHRDTHTNRWTQQLCVVGQIRFQCRFPFVSSASRGNWPADKEPGPLGFDLMAEFHREAGTNFRRYVGGGSTRPVPLWSSAMDFEWRVHSCRLYEENNSQMFNVSSERLQSICYTLIIIDMPIIYMLTLRRYRV